MTEELLQYIWQMGLFNANDLQTTQGQSVVILKRGRLNTDSGPDFSNARIRIGDTEWAGHIEIHLHSDDWFRHRHHLDKAYNNTILHVVLEFRNDIFRQDGSMVPCINIGGRIRQGIVEQYETLSGSRLWIACAGFIHRVDHFTVSQMLDRVLIQRLERKTDQVKQWLDKLDADWSHVLYLAISRSFGFGTNSDAFEQLAIHVPLNILGKHRNDQGELEALFFGTAGFLDNEPQDEYQKGLQDEWEFFRVKYQLRGLGQNAFKFMRMRPGNFPTLRISQLAALMAGNHHLFSLVLNEDEPAKIIACFRVTASAYWQTHYKFGKTVQPHSTELSIAAIQNILINAVVPVLFVYGQTQNDERMTAKAINLLHQLPAEHNHIITEWSKYGIHSRTAFDSQALLELKHNYCDEKKCLECRIGSKVLGL